MTGGPGPLVGYELPGTGLPDPTRFLLETAAAAEAAGVGHLVLADRPAANPAPGGFGAPVGSAAPAALIAASLLAVRTTRVGLVVTATTAYTEPYDLARMIASVDHISHGRAGWRVVTGPDPAADANHRREGVDPATGREARAREYVPLVRDLWDTWEDDAFVHDKSTGRFIDAHGIHVLDHRGPALRVRGPLNVVRPPQGHPVCFADAADPLVADAADVLTTGDPDVPVTSAEAGGRPRLGVVTPFLAGTEAAARDLHARSGAPRSDRDRAVLVGDAGGIAERLRAWYERGAVDGFVFRFPSPAAIGEFTAAVLPRLRPAGRSGPAPSATTLRDHFGLARPANRLAERLTGAAGRQGGERDGGQTGGRDRGRTGEQTGGQAAGDPAGDHGAAPHPTGRPHTSGREKGLSA
ncbi:LLM class flavin-dependent oxidoreductase [Streptomyces sp. LP05-1]|uniref:LLM class flavin-dependent oxidoreductase n=1 Tax=Streptomyces pyxinae TaxID=2970734 RepID=A0ABT2CRD2_9ACTN|nr:LLM class flavin-dependent oxidoreductase [Streptomyces sp. LP05-1]MCS0639647.1 LLM class flavin-dependent oxidoreductase [Streptomyces sp. LP05-1]